MHIFTFLAITGSCITFLWAISISYNSIIGGFVAAFMSFIWLCMLCDALSGDLE